MELSIKKNIRNTISDFEKARKFKNSTKAFKKRYKKIEPSLLKNSLDKKTIDLYKNKWSAFGKVVELDTLLLCYNLSGKLDLDVVPENIFSAIIEPALNCYKERELSFISVKNIYEKWFEGKDIFPKSYFHKINDVYYDSQFGIIEDLTSFINDTNFIYPLICKPSMGTSGGVGVRAIKSLEELASSLDSYDNLVYQEKIKQNKQIEKINPSINSIRTCLLRTKSGKFKVINNSIRFGVNGSLDNETAGGIVCNIDENGKLNDYAVSKYCEKYKFHPNSKVVFANTTIPLYDGLIEVAENTANQIPLCNLVSLDMCLDDNNKWRCIEVNLNSQTIRFRQYSGFGFFGKYTDEVIEKVANRNENSHTS